MPVTARRSIRRMRGGAQAHLMEADDGKFYVVKFQNNPQHPRILINEVIASEILSYLDVAAPEHRLIRVTPEFLAASPEVFIQVGTRHTPVKPGWHFASLFPGDPDRVSVYDFLPDTLLPRIANPEQFVAVLVFDKWVANADGRQAIFFRAQLSDWLLRPGIPPRKLGFLAQMIDHGYAFNGPHWELPDSPVAGLYSRRLVYESVRTIDSFEPWLSRVRNFPPEILDKALRQIPPDWIGDDEPALMKLAEALLRRRERIGDLLLASRGVHGNPFPNWR